ncbi:MAG: helix-turn-helix domain-containing protein [Clostridiales bacterium]|nr:helix-turn-helix domain-containing protein [Clostridiales bacterium]
MRTFGMRIKELRNDMNLNQTQLANLMGIAQTTIANYENDKRFPNQETLVAFSNIFNTSVDYLLGRFDSSDGFHQKYASLNASQKNRVYSEIADQYLDYLLKHQKYKALYLIANSLNEGLEAKDFYLKVFRKVLWQVGEMWERNEVTIAQEHYISNITQIALSNMFLHFDDSKKNHKVAISIAVNGDPHTLGARMISDYFELEGWNTYHLGGNLPIDQLINSIVTLKSDLLIISVTMPYYINTLENTIYALRKDKRLDKLKIIVGGKALDNHEEILNTLEIDGYGKDFDEAIKIANLLIQ